MAEPTTQPFTNSCATMRRRALHPFSLLSGNDTFVMSGGAERPLTGREQVEYTALRATIRERGTVRICTFAGGIVAWGALAVATAAVASTPIATLLPLLALAAVFEAVFALHIGVERVGRYLQVFYESDEDDAAWEHVAMSFGRPAGAVGLDPVFTAVFLLAGGFNLIPALVIGPTTPELIFVGGAHALLAVRVIAARAGARAQRKVDLARFRELRTSGTRVRESGAGSRDQGLGTRE
jgi:hypothetical protein